MRAPRCGLPARHELAAGLPLDASAMQARLDASDLAELALTAVGSEWRFVDLVQPVADWPLLLLQSASRCVVASRDVAAGELVFADEPFAQTVHDRWQDTVCHVCYTLLAQTPEAVRRCAECEQVVYCGAGCEARGAADHEAECDVLAAVRARGDSQLLGGVRGLRLFIRLLHRAAAEPEAFAARVERMSEQYEAMSKTSPTGPGCKRECGPSG